MFSKIKKTLASFLALLFLFSFSLQTYAATITVDTSDDDSTITGDCELREAVTSANSNGATDGCSAGTASPVIDDIQFNPGLSGSTITLTGGQLPIITETVNIDGDINDDDVPDISIDAGGTSRILDVNSPDVTVQGFNFLNGAQAGQNGGAIRIRSAADLALLNSTIDDPAVVGTNATNGGAISAEAGADQVVLDNVQISNTSALSGGAIFVGSEITNVDPEDFELQMTNSSINNTHATVLGGGGIEASNNSEISLQNVTISFTTAAQHGGAIHHLGEVSPPPTESANIIMEDVSIDHAEADISGFGYNGGCIHTGVSNEIVSNDDLNLNNCEAFWGGGIYVGPFSYMTIIGSADIGNNSAELGGGAYVEGDASFTIDGTAPVIFADNNAVTSGGGLYVDSEATDIVIDNADFISNDAVTSGGAIFVSDTNTVNIFNSEFYGNTANGGGGIATLGGVDIPESVVLNISDSNFEGNIAIGGIDPAGGAILAGNRTIMALDNITTDVPALGPAANSADFGGFLFMANLGDNSVLVLTDSNISNATALTCGGMAVSGAFNPTMPPIQLTNVIMSSNSATSDNGGAICMVGSMRLDNVDFNNNTADNDGGALYLISDFDDLSTEIINGSDFTDNSVTAVLGNDGGAIHLDQTSFTNDLIIDNSIFDLSNTTAGSGGGIHNANGTVSITNSSFIGAPTMSVLQGGGININAGTVTIDNSIFSGLSVTFSGGAIENIDGIVNLSNSTITGNQGAQGAALVSTTSLGTNQLNINKCYIGGNSASSVSGGIAVILGDLSLINSTVENNTAGDSGGGIYLGSVGTADIISSTIAYNDSLGSGGGIYVEVAPTSINLQNSILEGNTAAVSGPDCFGATPFSTGGFNIYSNTAGCGGAFQGTDILNQSADLGALGLHGGTTLNYTLLASSPAINNGNTAETVDQRGVARPQGGIDDIGSHEYQDAIAPIIAEVTPVPTPTTDSTPDYTFSTTEDGTITYGGGCTSTTTNATVGPVTITFNVLAPGTYSLCTITVTDVLNNISNLLAVTSFTIIAPPTPPAPPSSGSGGGFGQPACSGSACPGGITPPTEPIPPSTPPAEPSPPTEPTPPTTPPTEPTSPTEPTPPSTPPAEPSIPPVVSPPSTVDSPPEVAPPETTPSETTPIESTTSSMLLDPSASANSLTYVPRNYGPFTFSKNSQACDYNQFQKTYNLPAIDINQDTDGDGLSDRIECQVASNPNNLDSDGDGKTDSEEVLGYNTNPNQPDNFFPSGVGQGFVIVTLPEDDLITADDSPVFFGLANPQKSVDLYLFNSATFDNIRLKIQTALAANTALTDAQRADLFEQQFGFAVANILQKFLNDRLDPLNPDEAVFIDQIKALGNVISDQNGLFALDTSLSLRDNRYLVMGNSGNAYSLPVQFLVDSSLLFITPEAETLGGKPITSEAIAGHSIIDLDEGNTKPVLTGKVTVPSRVVATWQSNILSSALLADTLGQEFRLIPPKNLEPGEHTVILTAYRSSDNTQSKSIKLNFKVHAATPLSSAMNWWPYALAFLLAGLLLILIMHRRQNSPAAQKVASVLSAKTPVNIPAQPVAPAATPVAPATPLATTASPVPTVTETVIKPPLHRNVPPIHQGPQEGLPDDPIILPPFK